MDRFEIMYREKLRTPEEIAAMIGSGPPRPV